MRSPAQWLHPLIRSTVSRRQRNCVHVRAIVHHRLVQSVIPHIHVVRMPLQTPCQTQRQSFDQALRKVGTAEPDDTAEPQILGVTAFDAAQVILELGQHQLRRCLQGRKTSALSSLNEELIIAWISSAWSLRLEPMACRRSKVCS